MIYYFAADIITFMVQLVYKKNREKFRLYKSGYILAILAFFCLYVPVRIVYDYYTVSVRTITYEKRSVPGVLENFRIVFVSDLQADRYTDRERLQHFVNKINSANPDLVLFAGDFITSTPAYIQTAAEYAGRINSPYGIYSCIGDHDNWAYRDDTKRSIREISDALSKRQIKMINNDNEIIMIDSARICITFVTNTYEQTIEKSTLGKLTRINDDCDLKIFLTHQPRQFLLDEAIKKNYDLFLAGHTHGGQLTLLVPFLELSPTKIETRYQRGDFRFGNLLMVVTRGLGMSLAPIRYNSTPEVSVIELKSG
ncbi:MAG: metallophosphoesterase [Ignavibacteriaceae bacterium]